MITREMARDTYRAHNMRVTPQRLAVVEELSKAFHHPTAEDVARSVKANMPGVSLSTIYKTLNELVDLGLVKRVESRGSGEPTRFDPNTDVHGHLHCTQCGRVLDIDIPDGYAETIKSYAKKHGISVEEMQLELTGICQDCR